MTTICIMKIKSFSELSLNISEELYRELPQLSYSTLARYEKGGFSSISKLFEETEQTEALLFGSAVDTIITKGKEEFNKKFYISDIKYPSEALYLIALFLLKDRTEKDFNDIPDEAVLKACNEFGYCAKMTDAVRVQRVKEGCLQFYNSVREAQEKTVITYKMYDEVMQTVNALLDGPVSKYLQPQRIGEEVEFIYQPKFIATIDDLEVKGMMDLLIVNHEKKIILPIDLKTTSFPEYDFPKRFLENHYDIQSRLYWRILEEITKKDDYFKDFTIGAFRFIVVNKDRRQPLIFKDENCNCSGEIEITSRSGKKFILRDPLTIGKELNHYLNDKSIVPDGIDTERPNSIYERIKLL